MKQNFGKRTFYLYLFINIILIGISAILFFIFFKLNESFIREPQLSPHYNLGAAFGDGPAKFEFFGIVFPIFLQDILLIFNCLFSIFCWIKESEGLIKKILLAMSIIGLVGFIFFNIYFGGMLTLIALFTIPCMPILILFLFINIIRKKNNWIVINLSFFINSIFLFSLYMFHFCLFVD